MKTIFVVDDNSVNLVTAEKALSDQYNVYTLSSAALMFELLEDVTPDLILLDIAMPDLNGFGALEQLKTDTRYKDIPVIFLTSRKDSETESLGFEKGALDFISKPFSKPVLLNRIKTHLAIEDIIRDRTLLLQQRTEKLMKLQTSMVSVLANMVENRDKLTGRHIERTTAYIAILLNAMIERDLYADEIKSWSPSADMWPEGMIDINAGALSVQNDPHNLETVISSARLHDVGKIIVTDLILNKSGHLTDEEFEVMKTHADEGEKIIESIMAESGDEFFLLHAKLFAGSHHERWDGTGYPRGLIGEEIPLQGRVMAIADVYDALVSDRPYKRAFSHKKAVMTILELRGRYFDPKLVDLFLEINDRFETVHAQIGSTEVDDV